MPTAAQVYLAIDILNGFASGDLAPVPALKARCEELIGDALSPGMWTGKVENGCVEYGRPPVADDPLLTLKVRAFDQIVEAHREWLDQGRGNDALVGALANILTSVPAIPR
jgi:hypothetical protein